MLRRENISVGMDDESGAPTPLRLLGFRARLGVTLRDDTDLDDGWTRLVGESDVGTAHPVEFGLSLALRGLRQIAEGGVISSLAGAAVGRRIRRAKPKKRALSIRCIVCLRFRSLPPFIEKMKQRQVVNFGGIFCNFDSSSIAHLPD